MPAGGVTVRGTSKSGTGATETTQDAPVSIAAILERVIADGFSAENLAFGMGGGLLQQLDRDTQRFALKCSAAKVDGVWIDVSKNPITDPGKRSKAGRLMLQRNAAGDYRTVAVGDGEAVEAGWTDAMVTVWENGALLGMFSSKTNIGRFAALKAMRVLTHAVAPGEEPIESLQRFSILINMQTARRLQLYPPLPLLDAADVVAGRP